MAEHEPQTTVPEAVSQVEQVVDVTDVPQTENKTAIPPETEAVDPRETQTAVAETEDKLLKVMEESTDEQSEVAKTNGADNDEKVTESCSFKEESNRVADLSENENKALQELKQLVQEALNKHELLTPLVLSPGTPHKDEKPAKDKKEEGEKKEPAEEKSTEVEAEPAAAVDPPPEQVRHGKPEVEVSRKEDEEDAKEKQTAEGETTETKVVAEVVEEKVAISAAPAADSVDDDGAKTVEAIEESVVAVSSSVPVEQPSETNASEDAAAAPTDTEPKETKIEETLPPTPPQEVFIWGIPLLADERSDVIFLKFLRARDFKVKDAFMMLKNTIRWRKEFGIDELVEQDLGNDLEKAVFMHGFDKEGHPVCYNIYGQFQNKELYQKVFSDEEKRQKFLRWRIQFLEKSIRSLNFTPGAICTIVQVNDLKDSPGLGKWELRQATKQALQLLQDNYPEFVAKQVFINVPWWYLAVNRMISPFLTQRTKSKFVFAGPSKSAETLLRYIAPEQLPVKYGGLSKDGEFGTTDSVTEITVRPAAKHTIEFPVTESCLLTWEVRVLGWDVSYGAEFVPSAEGSYTVIIHKARKVASSEGPVVSNSFKIGEPGKVVLTIDNPTSRKKKLLYRLKTKPASD